jgi:hypothetical protein
MTTTTTLAASISNPEVAQLCISLCQSDADAYCSQERTIVLNGNEVTGTCRAFAKKNNVDGFKRCQGFCSTYPKDTTRCKVDGKTDPDCDGIV